MCVTAKQFAIYVRVALIIELYPQGTRLEAQMISIRQSLKH